MNELDEQKMLGAAGLLFAVTALTILAVLTRWFVA